MAPAIGTTERRFYGPKDLITDYTQNGNPTLPIHYKMFRTSEHEMVREYTSDLTSRGMKQKIRNSSEWEKFLAKKQRPYSVTLEEVNGIQVWVGHNTVEWLNDYTEEDDEEEDYSDDV